ncbi:Ribose ABC transport system, permease protein RbsC (TC 3.A.1.2.1) [Halanaerobium saccharolyticum subsp. saccharolyticum DSM 6643]|uniref:Ribose ABC transport system, permease protein RbsC (TC 3.A.1.2.1) n=1 Tax=Halanaerobium saccharolyticum subsp. saccharolyticum DSM 6643 TaxID=1293054 RepID=M5DZL2_9FIRM|nr:ABC transporter permease [Halanaerobium saccharolyticum]CCU78711.1 Ribose ABC transport system, permease protein RbsC (TC 3.A.1.2.1) [Halanaerobium saccharolyticum subsp. saccharolyticum DSM 6643]
MNNVSKKFKEVVQSEFAILFILIGIGIVVSFLSPHFLTVNNILNILQRSAIIGVVALGMTFVILTGGIDLSVGGQVVLIGMVGAMMMVNGMSMILAVIMMIGLGIILGAINGFNVSVLKLPPFIATLAMMNISRGLSLYISKGKTIFGLPSSYEFFGLARIFKIPVAIYIYGLLFIATYYILNYTTFGRKVYASGSNKKAAWLSGIEVNKIKFFVYIVNGIMASVAAIILTSKLTAAPGTMGEGLELDAIASVVIGGTSLFGGEGNIAGTVVGTLIIVTIGNAMNLLAVSPFLQSVIKGLVILFAIILDMWRKGYIGNKNV